MKGMRLRSSSPLLTSLAPWLTTALAASLALRKLDDTDTWWHLAAGRWIVQHGTVPSHDTLSYTVPQHPWINLQWGFDVLLYLLLRTGGAPLLVLAAAFGFTLAVWMTLRMMRPFVGDLAAAALGAWVLLVAEGRFLIRPEVASFVLLSALLSLLQAARGNSGKGLWLMPVLMAAWVNLHALFVVGVLVIVCELAGTAATGLPPAWREGTARSVEAERRLLGWGSAAVFVPLANPFLLTGALFPLNLYSRINGSARAFSAIGEFSRPLSPPLSFAHPYKLLLAFSMAAVLGAAAVATFRRPDAGRPSRSRRRERGADEAPGPTVRLDVGGLLTFASLAWLSVLAVRNTGLFALGTAPFLARCLSVLASRLPARSRERLKAARPALATAFAVAVLTSIGLVVTNEYYRWQGTTREFGTGVLEVNFPIRASAFLREARMPGQLYNDLTSGGYLAWDDPLGSGVFIDGRLEVYDTRFFSDYMDALSSGPKWRAAADRFGVNTVLLFHRWENRWPLIRWLNANPGWALVYVDEVAVVFVRRRDHEAAIERGRSLLPGWEERTRRTLEAPVSPWQWPAGKVEALSGYGDALVTLGEEGEATEIYLRLVALGLPASKEFGIRVWLAQRFARTGDAAQARAQLDRAAAIDPESDDVRKLRRLLGG